MTTDTGATLPDFRPDLVPTEEQLTDATARIQRAYDDYVSHVSPAQMAIALKTAAYTLWVAEQIDARTAVDFGSGFTSYVLRQVVPDVWSVDDSPEWMAWTARFLERYGCEHEQLAEWGTLTFEPGTMDLVVYDFSSGKMRDDHYQYAVSLISPNGVGVMDDANHQGHQTSMYKAARQFKHDLYGLQDWTRDEFRRFAALVVPCKT